MKTLNFNKASVIVHRKSFSIKAGLVILILIFSLPLAAMPFSGTGNIGQILERIADRLELSEQQRADIKLVLDTAKSSMKPIAQELKENRRQYEQLLSSSKPSAEDIQAVARQQGQLVADSLVMRAEYRLQINALLTAEQQIKLQAYKEARQDMASMRQKKHKRR